MGNNLRRNMAGAHSDTAPQQLERGEVALQRPFDKPELITKRLGGLEGWSTIEIPDNSLGKGSRESFSGEPHRTNIQSMDKETKMNAKILITGATGNLGRAVVQALVQHNFNARAATRNPEKLEATANVEPVKFDYTVADTLDTALAGVNGLLLIAPPMDPEAPAKLLPVIEKAKAKGIGRIILNSALGADQNEQSPLRIVERVLMQSGVPYTIVRPNFFMENFSTGFIAPMIKHQRGIFLAAGDGKTSFISTRDIAAVIAVAFAEKHAGKEYNLTGPEAIDHAQAAKLISEAMGQEIVYHALPEEAMLKGARDNGMPESAVQYLGALYSAVRDGYCAAVTDDVKHVTGQNPVSFRAFVEANKARWQ